LSFDAKLDIFDGFRNVFQYQAGSLGRQAEEQEAQWTEFKLNQDIRTKFYEAIAAQKLASVADQNLRTLDDHMKKIKIRRSGGVATRYDVLRVEVQLDEAQSDKVSSDDNVVVTREALAELMGLERDDRNLSGELPIPNVNVLKNLDVNNSYQYLSSRSDIVGLAKKVDAADRMQAGASAYWVPQFSVGYDYTYYNTNDDTLAWGSFGSANYLGVFMTWNIFDGAASIAKHKEAAEETRQAEMGLRSAQLKFKTDFDYWRRQYLYNTKLYEARVADVDKSQEAVRLADEGYRAGTRTTSEVLDAELDLFRARAGAVKAQMTAIESQINLESAIGRKL
jgi:outer membrane protein TolC